MIVTLKLAPGASVSEAALAQALGIGRTPIREALHRLAREGLVSILPRRGIIVTEINPILDIHNKTAHVGMELILSAFGKQIL